MAGAEAQVKRGGDVRRDVAGEGGHALLADVCGR